MKLEDAIEHAKEIAAEEHAKLPDCSCAVQHRQLAHWLQELKDRRDAEEHRDHNPVAVEETLVAHKALRVDGFDKAILGYVERCGKAPVALYDREKCIQILMDRDRMSREKAEEFFGSRIFDSCLFH